MKIQGSMTVVGFGFTRMEAERKEGARGRLDINNNLSIRAVEKTALALGKSNQEALRFLFSFTSVYEPDAGKITLDGEILDIEDEQTVKDVLAEWNNNKKVPQQVMARILNTALNRCNVQALLLSREINLPPPIPMPRVNVKGIQENPAVTETKKAKKKK